MKNKVLYVLKKELREVFRDKKSLSMMLIIPIMIPLLVLGMSFMFQKEANKDVKEYNKIGFAYTISDDEQTLVESLKINASSGTLEEMEEAFKKKEVFAYIKKENNNYTIFYDDSNVESSGARSLAEAFLENYKSTLQNQYLASNNVDLAEYNTLLTYEYNIVEKDNFYANYMLNYAFLFIIMAITISATYPATDATAGEKERGTLETLLTFPIKGKDIILGKLCSVTISSIITGFVSLLLTILSLYYVSKHFSIYDGVILINFKIIIVTCLIILCYSLLISGLCIAIASMSKSFKEAQSALTPITFISFFPGMIAFMLNINNSAVLSIIPFVNFTMIFQDISSGIYNYLYIALMFISTILLITVIITYIIRQYKSENVLFTN